MEIVEAIDKKIGEVRTESLDISIGEISTLHNNNELTIQPDFQRLFRWSNEQRSRLVESILLELPIPSIFVIERESGILELIDGLQRVSSLIQFINSKALDLDPLALEGCDLIPELNGHTYDDLPLTLKLRLKRSAIRTVIIKRQSSQFLRYEMFKRLNTGGSKLSEQDIRNVNARMLGEFGIKFYDFIIKCASLPSYDATVELLSTSALETRGNEELVLRFFAAKNYRDNFKGSISDWLDDYMDTILLKHVDFDFDKEFSIFEDVFRTINEKFGSYAFVKYRGGAPVGGVAPAYFEAVSIGAFNSLDQLKSKTQEGAKTLLSNTVSSEGFRQVTGPGANSFPKLERRILLISEAFSS